MSLARDQARPVRSGQEPDSLSLSAYLEQQGLNGPFELQQFPGGFSNLTYLIRGLNQEWVLRRPPPGANVRGGHDMEREFRILSALHPASVRVPRPLFYCDDESILGAPFYFMERVSGAILRGAGSESCTPELMAHLSLRLIEELAQLHSLDPVALGLADLGKADGYVARQIRGWTGRWHQARTDDSPSAQPITDWLAQHQPVDTPACLIHNDFKYDNLVLDADHPGRVLAILDWEMATLGDAWMDLGTTLGYWVDAHDSPELQQLGLGPTFLPGNLNRIQLVQRYQELRGACPTNPLYYYVFGLFKVAVIAQQIYARYRRGLTQDPRFGHLHRAVRLLLEQAQRSLERGQL